MALTSTLGSPGIEIREVDNSLRLDTSTGTTVYIPGFAAQGPVDEVMSIGSMSDFETIYGVPTNSAERYFYYTVKSILDNTGGGTTVLCTRLPYGNEEGNNVSNQYTMLAYPAVPVVKKLYKKFEASGTWEIDVEGDKEVKDGDVYSSVTFPFDQYVLTSSAQKEQLEKAFEIIKVAVTGETPELTGYTPEIINSVLSIDEELIQYNKLEVTQIDNSGVSFPEVGKTINLVNFDKLNSGILAPVIKFNDASDSKAENELIASGFVALEKDKSDDAVTYVHLSYSIKKNVDEDSKQINDIGNGTPVGSLYLKLKYELSSEDIEGNSITGMKETDPATKIVYSLVKSHEEGVTYSGQQQNVPAGAVNTYEKDVTFVIGSPVTYQVSLSEYYEILTNTKWSEIPYDFTGKLTNTAATHPDSEEDASISKFAHFDALGHAAFIVLNTSRSIINEEQEGLYIGLTDNMFITPSDDYQFNAITDVRYTKETYDATEDGKMGMVDSIDDVGDFDTLRGKLNFKLEGNSAGSISKILSRDIVAKDISGDSFNDTISMALFNLTKTADDSEMPKLGASIREKYNWSFGKSRMMTAADSTKPVSYFAETVVEDSKNIAIMMNRYVAEKAYVDGDGTVRGKMRVFGDKLLSNLERIEASCLRKTVDDVVFSQTEVKAIDFAKTAQESIAEWEKIVAKAGVTPGFLKTTFKSYSAASAATIEADDKFGKFQPLNSLIAFSAYTPGDSNSKSIGEVPAKLERALSLVENDELYPDIDIVLESGLGTIYINAKGDLDEDGNTKSAETFDETTVLKGLEDLRTGRTTISDLAQNVKENYVAVQNVFLQFANSQTNGGRGDCFYISDIPRGVLIKGKDTKVTTLFGTKIDGNSYGLSESVNHSFPTSVYYPIYHTFDGIVSSYMSTYAQWVKILDKHSAKKVWIPISGYIAANMCATDTVYGPWYAAAGLRRGVINGTLDYAISPNVSQRTDLYKICINSVPKLPNYGVTIWGIRTMSKAATAFDQNTCRRTFLYMEKKVKQLLRYYLFEPNNSYTRLQIYNDIDPFLQSVKNGGGVYAYTLVCDTTINTPEVINNGDLAIRITAAPTRTAENIVVEFVANKYTEEIAASEG
jgi:hypothetical protein